MPVARLEPRPAGLGDRREIGEGWELREGAGGSVDVSTYIARNGFLLLVYTFHTCRPSRTLPQFPWNTAAFQAGSVPHASCFLFPGHSLIHAL